MKKSEITFIRLMSLIGIMSLNLILLLVFSGEHVFQNILNRMNSNVYEQGIVLILRYIITIIMQDLAVYTR